MLNKIKNCNDVAELHKMGISIDLSDADRSVKVELYEAIEVRLKYLRDAEMMNEEIVADDISDDEYCFEE